MDAYDEWFESLTPKEQDAILDASRITEGQPPIRIRKRKESTTYRQHAPASANRSSLMASILGNLLIVMGVLIRVTGEVIVAVGRLMEDWGRKLIQ